MSTPSCPPLRRDLLPHPVDLPASAGLPRAEATRLATQKAHEIHPEVMLLAWFDRRTGEFSPPIPCCRDEVPGWLAYALSRGADLAVSLNHEEYVFIFKRL